MRPEIENRLHRVKIMLEKKSVICPISNKCSLAENCARCNEFYKKCSIYIDNGYK